MAELLAGIKGRFLLSINDTPEVRAIFYRFQIETVNTTYSVNAAGNRKVTELIISDGRA